MKCTIRLIWSDESRSWHCESDDIPGLVLGSDSFDTLVERILLAAPEMLELNCNYTGPIDLSFESERVDSLSALVS